MGEMKVNAALFFVGLLFLWSAMSGAVMAPELFGNAIYIIPAEAWAISIMVAALIIEVGIYLRGAINPALRILGNCVMLSIFGAFTYLSSQAIFGSMVVAFSAVLFVPQCLQFIYDATRDLWRIDWK